MRNFVIALLAVCVVGLGSLCIHQSTRIVRFQSELEQLRAKAGVAEQALAQRPSERPEPTLAEQKARILQETLNMATEASAQQSLEVARLEQSLAAARTNTSGFADMFKKPEMREMILQQQKAVVGPIVERNYTALVQSLNLSPEQAQQFRDLISQKMLASTDAGMSMLDSSLDAEKRKELAARVKTETDAFDAQIRELLGDDQYKQFQEYEKVLPDRTNVGQFRDQLAGTGHPLNSAQEEELIQIINRERTGFKWSLQVDANNPGDPNLGKMFEEATLNQRAQEQAALDGLIVDRARQILQTEQIAVLEKYLSTQRDLQIASMRMASMFFRQEE